MAAQGPGMVTTAWPAARASRTSLKPGSEISGVPASETSAIASVAHPRDEAGADAIGVVIVIGGHRPLDADMVEQLGGDAAILDRDQIGAARGPRRRAGERSPRLPIGVATI